MRINIHQKKTRKKMTIQNAHRFAALVRPGYEDVCAPLGRPFLIYGLMIISLFVIFLGVYFGVHRKLMLEHRDHESRMRVWLFKQRKDNMAREYPGARVKDCGCATLSETFSFRPLRLVLLVLVVFCWIQSVLCFVQVQVVFCVWVTSFSLFAVAETSWRTYQHAIATFWLMMLSLLEASCVFWGMMLTKTEAETGVYVSFCATILLMALQPLGKLLIVGIMRPSKKYTHSKAYDTVALTSHTVLEVVEFANTALFGVLLCLYVLPF